MDTFVVLNLVLLVVFILLTAFFVGAEFAVVKLRMSRIEQMVAEGNKSAIIAKKVANNLDYYLSACQLGITVTALALGALSKPTVKELLYPVFSYFGTSESLTDVLSYAISLALVTFLHVVIGELAPKTLAIQYTERVTLILARPLYWFGKIMAPLIFFLNGSSRVFLKMFGVKPANEQHAHSEEELRIIMAQSYKSGEINETEFNYMQNIFKFNDRDVKDIMVPRPQIISISNDMDRDEIRAVINEHQFTRYLVTDAGNKDRILGFINVKEMLTDFVVNGRKPLEQFIHDVPIIHESTTLHEALLSMQSNRVHIAQVVDEYGGTAGMLTMEDILEEIVGEIHDEFDDNEVPHIQKINETTYKLNGRVLLDELEAAFGLRFNDEDKMEVDTIAGWLIRNSNEVKVMTELEAHGHKWTVMEMDNHQIINIKMKKLTSKSNHENMVSSGI